MINQPILSNVLNLAETCWREKVKPDVFAIRAALLVSEEVARASNCYEMANFAAFNALSCFLSMLQFSTKLSIVSMKEQELLSIYDAEQARDFQAGLSKCEVFSKLVEQIRFSDVKRVGEDEAAFHAASLVFLQVYTSARAAYVFASLKASFASNGQKESTFSQAMVSRFHSDLQANVIESGLFTRMMAHPLTSKIAIGFIVMGLLALATTAVCASSLIGVGVGVGVLVAGAAIYSGGFFAQRLEKEKQKQMEETLNALNEDNRFYNVSPV